MSNPQDFLDRDPALADPVVPAGSVPSPGGWPLWRQGLMLALIASALLFTGLGSYPLLDQDESRYGQIPREMLEANDWLAPRMFGKIYTDKPPLQYWQVMVSYQIFGRSEFAARLPVALAALAAIIAVFWLVARVRSVRAGWIAGLTLTTMLFAFAMGRYLVLDEMLSTYVLLAAVLIYANLPRPPETPADAEAAPTEASTAEATARVGQRSIVRAVLAYLLLALATLVKGPVAGLLFGLPFVLYYVWLYGFQFWNWRMWWRMNLEMYLWLGLPLTLAVATPWFVLMDRAHPGFLHEFIVVQNLERVSTDAQGRNQPFWYFFVVAIAGLFPWVTFVPGAIARYFRNGWTTLPVRQPLAAFALLFACFPILFFSLSHSKLIPYIAPSFPGFAMILGLYFDELIARPDQPSPRIAAKVLAVAAISIAMAPLAYAWIVAFATLPIHVKLEWPALVCFALPMLTLAGLLLKSRQLSTRWIVAVTAGCMAAFLGLSSISGFTRTLGEGLSHAALMEVIVREQADDRSPIYVFRTTDEEASFYFYHENWRELRWMWASAGEANYIPEQREMIANGHSRVLMKRKYLNRFRRLFGEALDITVMHEIGNSFELAVDARPPPKPSPAPRLDAPDKPSMEAPRAP